MFGLVESAVRLEVLVTTKLVMATPLSIQRHFKLNWASKKVEGG